MISDEKYIESRSGKRMPFKVPDGYFDNLAQSVIGNAIAGQNAEKAEKPLRIVRQTWWQRYRRMVAAAACAAFAIAGLSTYMAVSRTDDANASHVAVQRECQRGLQSTSSADDDEIDYTMLDNDDIYSLVASN